MRSKCQYYAINTLQSQQHIGVTKPAAHWCDWCTPTLCRQNLITTEGSHKIQPLRRRFDVKKGTNAIVLWLWYMYAAGYCRVNHLPILFAISIQRSSTYFVYRCSAYRLNTAMMRYPTSHVNVKGIVNWLAVSILEYCSLVAMCHKKFLTG
jgi:hypothetical protein